MSLLTLGIAAIVAGCGTNYLPEYLPKVSATHVVTYTQTEPTVSMGSSSGGGPVGLMTDLAGIGVAVEMQERLRKTTDGKALAAGLTGTFQEDYGKAFSISVVPESGAHDSVIEIDIMAYGFEATSLDSMVYFHVDAEARMIYVPEKKLVWERYTSIHKPLNEVIVTGIGPFSMIGTAMNLAAINKLTDEELSAIFDVLAADAGRTFAAQMVRDAQP